MFYYKLLDDFTWLLNVLLHIVDLQKICGQIAELNTHEFYPEE